MTQKIGKVVTLFVTAVVIFAGCATVKFEAVRTPTLDTTGIQRVAVIPFEAANDAVYRSVSDQVTRTVREKLQATGQFQLVDHTAVQAKRQKGESYDDLVDAVFTGKIDRIGQNTEPRSRQVTNSSTGVTSTVTYYYRVVEVQFSYGFTRARDGSIIGPVNKTGRASDATRDNGSQNELESVEVLAIRAANNQLGLFARDVAPYTITLRRSLEKESKKDLQPAMKDAQALVKEGAYKAALEAYLKIYNENKNIAAAINASILYEATGDTQAGLTFMQGVYTASGNPKAKATIDRLNDELKEMSGASAFDDDRSPAEKVADYAKDELQKILPAGAKLLIQNNATTDKALVDTVIDNLTSSLLSGGGFTVVDRENLATIMKEQGFQTSGEVSDSDMVSIGNKAGANTIIIINITGTAANRRLQLKVLDMEKATLVYTSDTSDNWKL